MSQYINRATKLHPVLIGVESVAPPYRLSQADAKQFARHFFGAKMDRIDDLLDLFDNTGIHNRNLAVPLEWFDQERTFEEKNATYIDAAIKLSTQAIQQILTKHALVPSDITHVLFVSTTGLATPSIDARLIGRLGFSPHTRRTPIWGLGCAGGALGLTNADDILRGASRGALLLINVELCSLTFHFHDFSKSNLVATALFSDAVTVALIVGAEHDLATRSGAAQLVASSETLWPDSENVMGWNIDNAGMQVVFAKSIPDIVRARMAECVDTFLASADLRRSDIAHYLIHPGGRRVIEAYNDTFAFAPETLSLSAKILREHGNCSSCTVMLVIEEFLRSNKSRSGEYAFVTALGPGFCAGNALLRMI